MLTKGTQQNTNTKNIIKTKRKKIKNGVKTPEHNPNVLQDKKIEKTTKEHNETQTLQIL